MAMSWNAGHCSARLLAGSKTRMTCKFWSSTTLLSGRKQRSPALSVQCEFPFILKIETDTSLGVSHSDRELSSFSGVGEEELSNTGFMGLQAMLGGYQEASRSEGVVSSFEQPFWVSARRVPCLLFYAGNVERCTLAVHGDYNKVGANRCRSKKPQRLRKTCLFNPGVTILQSGSSHFCVIWMQERT